MRVNATGNAYADRLGEWYDEIPKAVLAAIAVSALTAGGEQLVLARERVRAEWQTLYDNGIVPQRPPGRARR